MLHFKDYSPSTLSDEGDGSVIMSRIKPSPLEQRSGPDDTLLCTIGRLIYAWGTLETQLEQKILQLRQTAGDIRIVGARTRPTMAKMLAELRAIISMRNRRNNTQLAEIAGIERTIQMIDKFRMLVIQGFQVPGDGLGSADRALLCRDAKNNVISVSLAELDGEIARLDDCRERLLAL